MTFLCDIDIVSKTMWSFEEENKTELTNCERESINIKIIEEINNFENNLGYKTVDMKEKSQVTIPLILQLFGRNGETLRQRTGDRARLHLGQYCWAGPEPEDAAVPPPPFSLSVASL